MTLPCGPETRYQPTVAQLEALDRPVDGLVVASPGQPDGHDDRPGRARRARGLVRRARRAAGQRRDLPRHHLRLRGDRDGRRATSAQGAVVVNSFSKYWAMTGWRLGWLVLPDDLVTRRRRARRQRGAVPAGARAARRRRRVQPRRVRRRARERRAVRGRPRRCCSSGCPTLGWSRVAPADGAFYLYADISASGLDSITWCARLLDEAGVALTPGTDFDPVDGHRLGAAVVRVVGRGGRARRSTGSSPGSATLRPGLSDVSTASRHPCRVRR